MKYKEILKNFFGNTANIILTTIAQLNPFNRFIKFSLEQFFRQIFKDQTISYENLTSGIIQLPNLEVDTQKINKKYFFATPYTLNSGTIGHLKIKLPSFTQMDKQNIEVEIKRIDLNFEPIQNFQQNFKKIMEEIKDFLYHFVEQKTSDYFVVQKGSTDYFKETLKDLLSNMKVRIEDIAVCVNLQKPQKEPKNDSFGLLLKVPLINVHRGVDSIKKEKQGVEQINFDCEIPQFSLHMIDSLSTKHEDFPFSFPLHTHSSTVLMFGLSQFKELKIETDERIPRFNISIRKSIEKAEKKVKLSFKFPQLQLTLNPSQIMIIILLAKQINAFSHRLKALKDDLKIDEQNQQQQIPFQSGQKLGRSNLYSSVSISLLQSSILDFSNFVPNISKFNNPPNVFDSIIEKNLQSNGELFQSIKEFNSVLGESISQNGYRKSLNDQVQCVNFKQLFQVSASIDSVIVCIEKYNIQSQTQRLWNFEKKFKYPKLKNSYFLLSIQTIHFHLKDDNSTQLKVQDFKLKQVKYKKEKQPQAKKVISMENSQINEDQFIDLKNSKQFYLESKIPVNQPLNLEHYDAEQIISISQSAQDKNNDQSFKTFNLAADLRTKYENQLYQPAILFQSYPSNSQQSSLKNQLNRIAIMDIALSLNKQIIKEIVDIYLLIEKQVFTLLKQNFDPKDKNINQKEKLLLFNKEEGSKKIVKFTFRAFIFVYLDKDLKGFSSCVQKYKKKIKQEFQTCFCGMQTHGVYFKVEQFELRKMRDNIKLSLNNFGLGLIKIDDSQMKQVSQILRILETLHENEVKRRFKLSYQDGKPGIPSRIAIISPQISIEINKLEEALDFIDLAHKQLEYLKPDLIQLMKTSSKVKSNTTSSDSKIQKSNRPTILQLFIERLNVKFLNIEAELHNFCVTPLNNFLLFKFSSIIVAFRDTIQFYTTQMQNQKPILMPHQKMIKYSNIPSTNIAIEIFAQPSHQFKCIQQKMSHFLDKISKAQAAFLLIVKNSDVSKNQVQQKPHRSFLKPLKSSNSIAQKILNDELQIGDIDITLSAPIYINAIILLKIIQNQDNYDNFFQKVKVSVEKMKETMNEIYPLEKDVKKLTSQVSSNKKIILSKGTLNIQIRPTFLQSTNNYDKDSKFKKQPKRIIFSNTRSFVQLSWEQTKVTQDQKKTYYDGSLNLKFYFKQSQNQEKMNNLPTNLESKGFIEILKLQKLIYKIEIIEKKVRVNVQINGVSFKSSIETLTWLNLHFKHFIQHNVKRNLGFTLQENEDRAVELRIQDFDLSNTTSQIVDLNDGQKIFKEKDKTKKQLEANFMAQKFVQIPLDEKCQFYIEKFSINSIQFKLTNKAKTQSSIDLGAKNFQIQAKIQEFSNFSLKLFGSISELKIVHKNKQQEGGWGFLSSFSNYVYSNCYGQFTVLQNHGQIKFLLEQDEKRTCMKFDKCIFDVGFRSVILEIVKSYNQFKQAIRNSGWKKVYDEPKCTKKIDQTNHPPLILVAIPENTISVSLIYDWYMILSKRSVNAPKFILHQESDKINKIDQFVIDWVKNLLSQNVSGLVTGALMQSFNLVVSQIVNLVRFLLSCIF